MTLRLRDGRLDEIDDLVEIMLAGYAQYEPWFPPAHWTGYVADIAAARDRLRESEIIVAEIPRLDGGERVGDPGGARAGDGGDRGGERVGVVTYFPAYRHSAIELETAARPAPGFRLLAVTPEGRGHGVGRALVEECVSRARAQNAGELVLHTATFMTAAVRLYERLGFERVFARGDDPERQLLEYRMQLTQ